VAGADTEGNDIDGDTETEIDDDFSPDQQKSGGDGWKE